jgi:hypothetical protein
MSRNQEAADVVAAKGHNRFDNVDDESFFRIALPDWIGGARVFYANEDRSCVLNDQGSRPGAALRRSALYLIECI